MTNEQYHFKSMVIERAKSHSDPNSGPDKWIASLHVHGDDKSDISFWPYLRAWQKE